jgi:hypothetical protein
MRFDRGRPHRLRDQSLNRLIPNMLTIGALCAGLTAVHFGLQGLWEKAIVAIVVAGILDTLDGRIARLLNGSSKFGALRLDRAFASGDLAFSLYNLFACRLDKRSGK